MHRFTKNPVILLALLTNISLANATELADNQLEFYAGYVEEVASKCNDIKINTQNYKHLLKTHNIDRSSENFLNGAVSFEYDQRICNSVLQAFGCDGNTIPGLLYDPKKYVYKSICPTKDEMEERTLIIKYQFNSTTGEHFLIRKMVMLSLKDPDSYTHIKTKFSDQGNHIRVTTAFRAKNSFGAYVIGEAVADFSVFGDLVHMVSGFD